MPSAVVVEAIKQLRARLLEDFRAIGSARRRALHGHNGVGALIQKLIIIDLLLRSRRAAPV